MKTIYGIAGKMYRIVRPVRDRHYLQYIRRFACVGCGTERKPREAMHTGPRGLGQKSNDRACLPGCRTCHMQLHALGPMQFQSRHKIDFVELQNMFLRFYCLEFPFLDDCGRVLATEAVTATEDLNR